MRIRPTIIQLQPEWFKMGYYVYVVVIKFHRKRYFYIGMTGDRHHLTARSPFYRMSGHFITTASSTQNQLIKGIERIPDFKDKKVYDILLSAKICYYSYLIHEFKERNSKHHELREDTESIEASLIGLMTKHYGKNRLLNKSIGLKEATHGLKIAKKIFEQLQRIDN